MWLLEGPIFGRLRAVGVVVESLLQLIPTSFQLFKSETLQHEPDLVIC